MKLPQYLSHHRRDNDAPYEISGAAAVMAFLVVLFFALAAGQAYLLRSGTLAAVISSSLVSLANADRQAHGLAPLSVNPALTAVAQAKANDMAAKGYFAHISPEGREPWYWFAEVGYSYRYAGENLAVDFTDSAAVEEAWMNSPEHRANLLDPRYTEIGIATAQGTFNGHPTTFVAQVFGTPAPAPTQFAQVPPVPQEETAEPAPVPPAATTTRPSVAGIDAASAPSLAGPKPAASVASVTPATVPTTTPVAAVEPLPPPVEVALAPALEPSWWAGLLASPSTVLGWVYYLLAVVTLLIFAYLTELELHRRHLRHAAEAGGLLALMLLLFTLAHYLFFAHPVLAAL